jgi:hypothetical protein
VGAIDTRPRLLRISTELKRALLFVWFAATVPTAASVAAPLVLTEPAIASITPVCESKRLYGRECVLCGATRAFIAISHGDWRRAHELNRGAIPLYFAFTANALGAVFVAGRRVTSKRRVR